MATWLFQANPERYNVVAAATRGFGDQWSMNQHRRDVAVGDEVFFFNSGAAAGIFVVGRVVSPVYETPADEFGRWKVDVEYDAIVEPPLYRNELLADAVTASYQPFRRAQGTNFSVPQAVASAARDLLSGRVKIIPVAPGAGFDESLHQLDQALVAHEDHVRTELLEVVSNLTSTGFERLIKRVLEAVGFENSVVTGRANDGGIDVRATLRMHSLTSVPTVVQAKRWVHNVSGSVVRELRGALVVGEQGIVITTSGFTKGAQIEAAVSGKTPIALVDGKALVQLMVEQGIGVRARPVSFNRIEPEDLLDLEAE